VARPLIVNPPELPEPVGFAHAVVAAGGVYLGGQTGQGATLVEQFESAASKLVTALRAAGGGLISSSRSSSTPPTSTSTATRRASSARPGASTSAGATPRWR